MQLFSYLWWLATDYQFIFIRGVIYSAEMHAYNYEIATVPISITVCNCFISLTTLYIISSAGLVLQKYNCMQLYQNVWNNENVSLHYSQTIKTHCPHTTDILNNVHNCNRTDYMGKFLRCINVCGNSDSRALTKDPVYQSVINVTKHWRSFPILYVFITNIFMPSISQSNGGFENL